MDPFYRGTGYSTSSAPPPVNGYLRGSEADSAIEGKLRREREEVLTRDVSDYSSSHGIQYYDPYQQRPEPVRVVIDVNNTVSDDRVQSVTRARSDNADTSINTGTAKDVMLFTQ